MRNLRRLTLGAMFCGAGLAGGVSGRAEEPDGALLYAESCATCHGPAAEGDGPRAGDYETAPPDLTLFAAHADGVFDAGRMVRLIDGREGLAAHGGPMPLFGGLLTGRTVEVVGADGIPVSTTDRIAAIVAFIETLQKEEEQ